MVRRTGRQTISFDTPPVIEETMCIAGKKESEGPLSEDFDMTLSDDYFGEESWEKAESKLQREAVIGVLKKSGRSIYDVDYLLAGDLLNQCVGASYGLRGIEIPFFGLYGACSTMAESMSLGAICVATRAARRVICITSSHYCSAEKQFRYPLEYGGQRPPTAQWTVTASGAVMLSGEGDGPRITAITTGRIIDFGINDANNMGAAMAPAACSTILEHLKASGTEPNDYDLILTGDLGEYGSDVLMGLAEREGVDLYRVHNDCGRLIFDRKAQDVHAGGSGCGCCASVFSGHIMKKLKRGELSRILLVATGALMNTAALYQGETIPSIAHCVEICSGGSLNGIS